MMKQPSVNRAKPDRWKADIALSVDLYNAWFMQFAPVTFREARVRTTKQVEDALKTLDLPPGLRVRLGPALPLRTP